MRVIKAFLTFLTGCLLAAYVSKGDELAAITPLKVIGIFLLSALAFLLMLAITFLIVRILAKDGEEMQT